MVLGAFSEVGIGWDAFTLLFVAIEIYDLQYPPAVVCLHTNKKSGTVVFISYIQYTITRYAAPNTYMCKEGVFCVLWFVVLLTCMTHVLDDRYKCCRLSPTWSLCLDITCKLLLLASMRVEGRKNRMKWSRDRNERNKPYWGGGEEPAMGHRSWVTAGRGRGEEGRRYSCIPGMQHRHSFVS